MTYSLAYDIQADREDYCMECVYWDVCPSLLPKTTECQLERDRKNDWE